jgi:hypothetical protein
LTPRYSLSAETPPPAAAAAAAAAAAVSTYQAVLSIIFIPMIFAPVKWYYVAVAYLVTPLFALPNSYGCGLTDWDCSSMYAKLALFVFAAWAGVEVRGFPAS